MNDKAILEERMNANIKQEKKTIQREERGKATGTDERKRVRLKRISVAHGLKNNDKRVRSG